MQGDFWPYHNRLNLFCLTGASSSSDVAGSGTETTIGMGIQTANRTAPICIIRLKRDCVKPANVIECMAGMAQ